MNANERLLSRQFAGAVFLVDPYRLYTTKKATLDDGDQSFADILGAALPDGAALVLVEPAAAVAVAVEDPVPADAGESSQILTFAGDKAELDEIRLKGTCDVSLFVYVVR